MKKNKLFLCAVLVWNACIAIAHADPFINSLSFTSGSASGGEALHIYGGEFGTPGVSAVSVTIGGNECTAAQLVTPDDIQCETPAGNPDDSVQLQVVVDGIPSINTVQFVYLQRPYFDQVNIVSYDGNGNPVYSPSGSASGGETLVLSGGYLLDQYVHMIPDTQPQSLQVLVGGVECANPVLVWSGPLVNPAGNTITCTTPAGTPGASVPVELFVNGVQDIVSFEGSPRVFNYLSRPTGMVNRLGNINGQLTLEIPEGSAAGGDTLIISSAAFIEYTHGLPNTQPNSLRVLIGGAECSNPIVHWDDAIGNQLGSPGWMLTCTTPSGTPGTSADIQWFVDGVQDQESLNGAPFLFHYLSRPTGMVNRLGNINGQLTLEIPEGSAAGGDTLIISSAAFIEYTYGLPNTQPNSLRVLIGGAECSNPIVHWDDAIGNQLGSPGWMLTCTTPSGTPGTSADIQWFVDGVQDQESLNGAPFLFHYLSAPTLLSITPNQGPDTGGTLITLNGDNFGGGGAQISIGGSSCAVQSQSNQQITCITAANPAGTYPVIVTIGNQPTEETLPFEYTGVLPPNGIFKGIMIHGNINVQ